MQGTYRKRVISPLVFYNVYFQMYNRFFHNFYTKTRKSELTNQKIEDYFTTFGEVHYSKLGSKIDNLKSYLLWLFSKYDKVYIFDLHNYIDEYLESGKNELDSFYYKIIEYIQKEKIPSWDAYVTGSNICYPKILEHYIAKKDFPFEFILYLKVLDNLTPKQRKIMKVILRGDLFSLDEKLRNVEENKDWFQEELRKILTGAWETNGYQKTDY